MENQTFTATIFHGPSESALINHLKATYPENQFLYLILEAETNSIKLSQIHQLQTNLALTSNKPRLVWLKQAHLATLPAQNALLKTLEEPPRKTLFILTTTKPKQLLATILSRCQSFYIPPKTQFIDKSLLQLLKKLIKQDSGQRLAERQQLPKDRQEALDWFNRLIDSLNSTRLQTDNLDQLKTFAKIIKPTLEARQSLQANLNLDLVIDHFLLSLPKTSNH